MRPSNKYIHIQFYKVSEAGKAKDCSKIVLKIARSLGACMVVEISMLLERKLISSLLLLIFLRENNNHILLKDYF